MTPEGGLCREGRVAGETQRRPLSFPWPRSRGRTRPGDAKTAPESRWLRVRDSEVSVRASLGGGAAVREQEGCCRPTNSLLGSSIIGFIIIITFRGIRLVCALYLHLDSCVFSSRNHSAWNIH